MKLIPFFDANSLGNSTKKRHSHDSYLLNELACDYLNRVEPILYKLGLSEVNLFSQLHFNLNISMKITKQQILKMIKKANRELSLKSPRIHGKIHKTAKKDLFDKTKNTLDKKDYEKVE